MLPDVRRTNETQWKPFRILRDIVNSFHFEGFSLVSRFINHSFVDADVSIGKSQKRSHQLKTPVDRDRVGRIASKSSRETGRRGGQAAESVVAFVGSFLVGSCPC